MGDGAGGGFVGWGDFVGNKGGFRFVFDLRIRGAASAEGTEGGKGSGAAAGETEFLTGVEVEFAEGGGVVAESAAGGGAKLLFEAAGAESAPMGGGHGVDEA